MRLHNYTSSSVCVSFAKIKSIFLLNELKLLCMVLKKKRRIMLGLTGVFQIYFCAVWPTRVFKL